MHKEFEHPILINTKNEEKKGKKKAKYEIIESLCRDFRLLATHVTHMYITTFYFFHFNFGLCCDFAFGST